MGVPVLTNEQVEALYDALLSNADRLCREAELLLGAGSAGRARSLVVLALEESAKAIAIHDRRRDAVIDRLPEPELDVTFWQEWASHRDKLRRVYEFLVREDYWFGTPQPPHPLMDESPEHCLAVLDGWARQDNEFKQRGFYVDVDRATGQILVPEPGDAAEVLEMITLVEQVGWQVRLGDHIVWKQALERAEGAASFEETAVESGEQFARMNRPGWEACRRHVVADVADEHD
ncbi:AbiV family abortive infection protein [Longispora sp. K20-0274]|uniref:AbiV family abortive infection protein n=1 Tax=Longispora sp. K20-0274 TaxID=3088255 RepID=UPI00399AE299